MDTTILAAAWEGFMRIEHGSAALSYRCCVLLNSWTGWLKLTGHTQQFHAASASC